jgi:hypothetical protein
MQTTATPRLPRDPKIEAMFTRMSRMSGKMEAMLEANGCPV